MTHPARSNLTLFAHLAAIIIVVMLIYSKVIHFDFLRGWDDQWFVLNDYTEQGFSRSNIYAIATDFYYGQYAPLNQLYYTIVYHFVKYEPAYYHVLNVLIHLSNAILIYFLSRQLALRLMGADQAKNAQVAFFTSFLFAILPVNLEPVAWVAASKVGLYALFYLLSIHSYLRFLNTTKPGYYYSTLLLFMLSFCAKEQAVTLPICLMLLDYVYKRPFDKGLLWYEKFPFLILSLLFGLITLQSQTLEVGRDTNFYPLYERVPLFFYTLFEYFTKIIFPVNISYLYPFPYVVGEKTPIWMWIYVISIPAVMMLLYRNFNSWVKFGLLFFVIHIALVANLVSLARFSIIADRYAYLSAFGICFIIGCFIVQAMDRSSHRNFSSIIIAIYFSALGLYTYTHCDVWKNVGTLKKTIRMEIRKRPDYNALKNKYQNHE